MSSCVPGDLGSLGALGSLGSLGIALGGSLGALGSLGRLGVGHRRKSSQLRLLDGGPCGGL